MNKIPIEWIQNFITFSKSENLSQAANSLGISQPSLTRHLQQFEEITGHKIFKSVGRNKKLTSLGYEIFMKLEGHWLDYSEIIESTISEFVEKPLKPVPIFGPTDWLNRIATNVSYEIPVHFIPTVSHQVCNCMQKNLGVSIGLTRLTQESFHYTAHSLFESDFKIIFSKKWKINQKLQFSQKLLAEFSNQTLLLFSLDLTEGLDSIIRQSSNSVNKNRSKLIIPNWNALLQLVQAGKGWAVAPSDVITGDIIDSCHIVDVPHSLLPQSKYFLMYDRSHKKISWFKKLINDIIYSSRNHI